MKDLEVPNWLYDGACFRFERLCLDLCDGWSQTKTLEDLCDTFGAGLGLNVWIWIDWWFFTLGMMGHGPVGEQYIVGVEV